MNKKAVVKTVSFFAALALILVGTIIKHRIETGEYERSMNNIYSSAVNTLCNSLMNINTELKKATYSSSGAMLSRTAAEIYRESGTAKLSLARLPAESGELEKLYKFISQAGDYSLYLSRQALAEETITEEERENLLKLSSSAEKFSTAAEQMRIGFLQSGELDFSQSTDEAPSLNVEKEEDYPTLIYDGPYSDHIRTTESSLLAAAEEISVDKALEIATGALAVPKEQLKLTSQTSGKIAAYHFEGDDCGISVTKNGGYISYFRKYHQPGKPLYSYEQAAERAKAWLSEQTSMSFKTSYYVADEGVCTVNFAYKEGKTVCYTDLIKIGVALDSGEIVLCEADGYIMNHKSRTIKTPDKTEQQAREAVSHALKIKSSERVLIPSGGRYEIQCYEFLCEDAEGDEVLVYINCDTLAEERIYLVVNISGGTLTK